MLRENANKKKEVSELRARLLKKEAVDKQKAQSEARKAELAENAKVAKAASTAQTKTALGPSQPVTIKSLPATKAAPVKSRTLEVRMPRPPIRRVDTDIALALALQQEEMELNEQLFMIEMMEERDNHIQRTGQDTVDPDNMTYEQLMDLQEQVGKVKVGLSPAQVARLRHEHYSPDAHKLSSCSICLNEFDAGQEIVKLGCLHLFDSDCLKRWVDDNKNCPICKAEITV